MQFDQIYAYVCNYKATIVSYYYLNELEYTMLQLIYI